jgi:hypothetical protein
VLDQFGSDLPEVPTGREGSRATVCKLSRKRTGDADCVGQDQDCRTEGIRGRGALPRETVKAESEAVPPEFLMSFCKSCRLNIFVRDGDDLFAKIRSFRDGGPWEENCRSLTLQGTIGSDPGRDASGTVFGCGVWS